MDKVKLKLTRNELVNLSDYLCDMVGQHNFALRHTHKGMNPHGHFSLRLRTATLVLASVRLQRLRIEVRPRYRVGLPVNECFALLATWVDHNAYPTDLRPMVQPLIGRIDQALS